jgi:hypothetical protein
MMRYFAPRQNRSTGKWHFTVQEGSAIAPVGPCADGCAGHATANEAVGHYAGFLLGKRMVVVRDGNFNSCLICGTRSNQRVRVGKKELHLCPEHQDASTMLRFIDFGTLMKEEHEERAREGTRESGLILPP